MADDQEKRAGWARVTVDVQVDDLDALQRRMDHTGNGEHLTQRIEKQLRKELRGTAVRGMQVSVNPGEMPGRR